MVMISKANTTNSSFGPGTEFIALTAAIVGGVSFMGGEGNMPGLVAAVLTLAILGNGMQLAGWGTYAQFIVRGLILLGAVAFDEYQKSAKRKRMRGKRLTADLTQKARRVVPMPATSGVGAASATFSGDQGNPRGRPEFIV